jgi:hypothetical protein
VKGADQILLAKGIDGGLAADGAVGLREQGGWQMDYRAATFEQDAARPATSRYFPPSAL